VIASLVARRYTWARPLAIAQVALIVAGWGAAQHPFLIAPDLTIRAAAAPDAVLKLLAIAIGAGVIVVVPSLYWLFHVFKRGRG
jgi:cytochrome d ubiquinol oxidase subunit II